MSLVHREADTRGQRMRCLVPLFALFGCVGEPEQRMCADFGSHTIERERCIPLYGTLLCATEEVTEVYCKRYFEDDKERKEE